MPTQPLPDNPSLENLRKQAKSLLKAVRANDSEARARVQEFHPRSDKALDDFGLTDAQVVVARGYDFKSWSELKRRVELYWMPQEDSTNSADRFIRLACLNYLNDHAPRRDEAKELFAADPSIGRQTIYSAATVGDVSTVQKMLATNPRLAKKRGGPNNWEPLLYAAYSRFNSNEKKHSTLEVSRLLLEHGADPNAGFLWDGRYIFTALTGVFGEGERGPIHQPEHQYCYELARILLEAGADPNDSQTLYNRMFTGGTRHLELLFEFGLGKGGNGVWSKRSGNLETPNEMLVQQVCWAAKYNQLSRLKLLVQHGVDLNAADTRHRRSPYELAVLNGNSEIADYLLANGAKATPLNDAESFFAACMNADEARARALLSQRPSLVRELGKDRAELLQLAAEQDKRDSIRLMAALGFDLNEVQRTTALHHAAMAGHLEMVKLLIELGADARIRDTEFNAQPLGWAQFNGKTVVAEFLKAWE